MAQQALPRRDARLGRAFGGDRAVQGVVLLLPGGQPVSTRRRSSRAVAAALPLARRLARADTLPAGRPAGGPGAARREESLVAHVVHYRCRGWNGTEAHPVRDAEWALEEVRRRYGDVPVCLAGWDMGARAALRAAGHPSVVSVLALAPWLPETAEDGGPEPVRQLAGRRVLLVHGTDDEHTAPDLSYRLAARAKKINPDVCRFEVHTDGHALRQHRFEVLALAEDFVTATLCDRDFSRPVADALAAPPPLGLRMPLAAGFGRSLRP
ncbi:alpha/beta hydrolase [Streptomyces sp. TRM43335]|uniref:Alpha/beta hydrolase n=1 Tax=Streptomyces taklimakanensis TaxID=2569853 RepID=A0A6G2BEQ3_9ACTN|nr:alpha/beta hydrolase [Streptomyces taklimakanensis]MTE20720.1 alpha/beta hydrolase [Streptomyces taklimakanensis]